MDKPYVVLHNSVSLDGRLTGFEVDLGCHYELMLSYAPDVHLAGSNTILANDIPPNSKDCPPLPAMDANDTRMLLVIPDSRGRVRCWGGLLEAGYWRGGLALYTKQTPKDYLKYIKRLGLDHMLAGEKKVDLASALEKLYSDFGLRRVVMDSGGILNGVMLQQGLVDEISLLVHPLLVGKKNSTPLAVFRKKTVSCELIKAEKKGSQLLWLRYRVQKE